MGGDLKVIKRLLAAGLSPLKLARGSSPLSLAFGTSEELQNHRLYGPMREQEHKPLAEAQMQQLIPDIHKIIRAMISNVNNSGEDLNQVPHACARLGVILLPTYDRRM